ncbi:BlaI/MecI/CopY family transcriptional regulator [Streptomyces sp. NPDC005828]|uniref:BlaI/MecI/CopY family transcriptional regulator n=1 Tax=Streptomyces sp. NPDC005828 TaxID=3157071 RepID=UPI0033D33C3C
MDGNTRDQTSRQPNGAREAQILTLLQHAGGALTPGEVVERLQAELTYSTVVTILTRMHGKGMLHRSPRGRAYAYAPVTDDAGFAARRMRSVLDDRPDREAVLARFADELSDADADLLRQMLGDTDGGGTDGADHGTGR